MSASFFRIKKHESRITGIIVTLFIILASLFVIHPVYAQVSTSSATTSAKYQPVNVNSLTPQSPQYANLMVNNLIHAFSCIMAGSSPIGQPCIDYLNGVPVISQVNNSGGLLGSVANLNMLVIASPPIRTGEYLATLGDSLGIVKEANAQVTGSGAGVLEPIMKLWQISRNISYVVMILIFVIIGLMVMFRTRLNPQTVITAQAALPGLVIGIILITFSYFLASLLTDTAYLATNLIGYYFQVALPDGNPAENLAQKATSESVLSVFGRFTNVITPGDATGVVHSLWDGLPEDTQNLLRAAAGLVAVQFGSGAAGNVNIPGLGLIVGLVAGIPSALAPVEMVGNVLAVIAIGALILQMIKLLFKLISNYLSIIFYTVTAPFHFLAASLPGRQAIAIVWIRNMLCNILAFPAVLAIFYFVAYLLGPEYRGAQFFLCTGTLCSGGTGSITSVVALPLLGGLNLNFIKILLAYGALVATPTIPDLVCRAIGQVGQAGQLVGQEIGAAGRSGQGYAQRGVQGAGQGIGQGVGFFRGNIEAVQTGSDVPQVRRTLSPWQRMTGGHGL